MAVCGRPNYFFGTQIVRINDVAYAMDDTVHGNRIECLVQSEWSANFNDVVNSPFLVDILDFCSQSRLIR